MFFSFDFLGLTMYDTILANQNNCNPIHGKTIEILLLDDDENDNDNNE